MRDPKTAEEIQKAAGKWNTVLQSMREMEEIRKKYGMEWNSDHAAEFDIYRTGAIGELSQDVGQTGTVNAGEFPRYKAIFGQLEPSILDAMPGDVQLQKIRGARRAMERLAGLKMGEFGLEVDTGEPAATPTGDPAADAQAASLGRLPTTATPGPKVPGAKPAPATRRLRLSDGSTANDTPGNRKALKDAGEKFEVIGG